MGGEYQRGRVTLGSFEHRDGIRAGRADRLEVGLDAGCLKPSRHRLRHRTFVTGGVGQVGNLEG